MADYTYAGSFPSSPSVGETMEMNGVEYVYSSLGTWDIDEGLISYDDTTIQAEVDLNTAKTGITSGQASAIVANTAKISVPSDTGSSDGDVLTTDGSGVLTWEAASGGITDIVEDTTPQLGGTLQGNGNNIALDSGNSFAIGNFNINTAPSFAGGNVSAITSQGNLTFGVSEAGHDVAFQTLNSSGSLSNAIVANGGNGVELYNNGSKVLETNSSGLKVTGDLSFDDNDKAVFGDGDDFEIYHNGTETILTGDSNSDVDLRGDPTKKAIRVRKNGAIEMYNNIPSNDLTFSITSGGAYLPTSKNLESGTLIVRGDGEGQHYNLSAKIKYDTTNLDTRFESYAEYPMGNSGQGGKFSFHTHVITDTMGYMMGGFAGSGAELRERLRIENNGDVKFMDEYGTSVGMTYDATNEKLGIGVTSPAEALDVSGNVKVSGEVKLGDWTVEESSGDLIFAHSGTNKMKIDSSGNLTVTGNVTAYGSV